MKFFVERKHKFVTFEFSQVFRWDCHSANLHTETASRAMLSTQEKRGNALSVVTQIMQLHNINSTPCFCFNCFKLNFVKC